MATRRSTSHVHPSRQDQVPNEPRRKRQKPNNAGPKSFRKAYPVNELKSKARSLKRLLEKNEALPADVRVDKERALQSVQYELEEAQKAKNKSDMIGRYHKVRFFDRQKATKRLKRASKELQCCENDGEAQAELKKKVEDAEVDVNYAQFYPLDQPYVSLFPRTQAAEAVEVEEDSVEGQNGAPERKGDLEMRQMVKQCMANGKLEALRNGKVAYEQLGGQERALPTTTAKRKSTVYEDRVEVKGARPPSRKESDEESDGGFFE